ncbi:MAG: EAL domain-containing protein [Gammaproteobacteria bacterium]|nr:EAL domain-containing protein [Gammaproteobacteria bacterium]
MISSDKNYHPLNLEPHALQLFEVTPVPMFLGGLDGSLEHVNTAFIRLLGFHPDDINLAKFILLHQHDFSVESHLNNLQIDDTNPVVIEKKYSHCSGDIIHAQLTIMPQLNNDGQVIRYLCQIIDISEVKKTQDKLQLASLVYDKSSEGMMVTDGDGVILDVNSSFTKITGYSKQQVCGKNASMLSSGRQDKLFYELMWESINSTGQWKGEIWNRKENARAYPVMISINTDYDRHGRVNKRVALFSDLSEIKSKEAQIFKQAYYDSITGLPNRDLFIEHLDDIINLKNSKANSIALMLLSMDGFKQINDTLGHEACDELLRLTAQRLQLCVKGDDFVARLGGKEFTIIVHDVTQVETIAQNILKKLAEPFYLENESVHITGSIGITLFPDDSEHTSGLLKRASLAMYSVKKQGRKGYSYFTPSMQQEAQKRLTAINELRVAIEKQEFVLYYQPIVTLSTLDVYKAEALVRWMHPEKGLIEPDKFIPIAEDTGQIIEIGKWVVNEALQQVYVWRETFGIDFQLSINESPLQFKSGKNSFSEWFSYLKKLGLPGEAVSIEITENLLLDLDETVDMKMQQFKDANIQISLDDFGTGYASLSYLKRFNFSYLKIDKSYVQSMEHEKSVLILCQSIIQMAHNLGIKVIAEGIETQKQLDILNVLNCDYGQGFFFSRPVPVDEFELLISGQNKTELVTA